MSLMESANITIENMRKMLEQGKRFDGRPLLNFRDFTVEFGVSNTAEGSARVRLGKTEVIAGVKLAPGEPYPDSPNKGNLVVSGDLLPLASPRFESGPPGFESIELPRLMDRAIRDSGILDLTKLCIKEGEKVWTIYIDVYPINDDGNLIDAAAIACSAALRSAVVPSLDENGKIDYEKESKQKLPVSDVIPLSMTFYKLGNSLFLDPTREEEESAESRITFGVSRWNGQHMINSCQKSGATPLTRVELEQIASILPSKFDELNERLKKFLKSV